MACRLAFLYLPTYIHITMTALAAAALAATTTVALPFMFLLVGLSGLVRLYGLVSRVYFDESFLMPVLHVYYGVWGLILAWLLLYVINDINYLTYYALILRL